MRKAITEDSTGKTYKSKKVSRRPSWAEQAEPEQENRAGEGRGFELRFATRPAPILLARFYDARLTQIRHVTGSVRVIRFGGLVFGVRGSRDVRLKKVEVIADDRGKLRCVAPE